MAEKNHVSSSAFHFSQYKFGLVHDQKVLKNRQPFFFATTVLVIFGCGVNCSVLLSSAPGISSYPKGDYLAGCFGWAVRLHCVLVFSLPIDNNVTLAMATWRGFAWKKVPHKPFVFIFAQLLGGFVGAALLSSRQHYTYFHAIDTFEGGVGIRTLRTAGLFSVYSIGYMTNVSAFFTELLATAILVLVIVALTNTNNTAPPALFPLAIFIVMLGIGISTRIGIISFSGFAMNPARDFGPRLLTAAVGYPGSVFSFRHQYWLWNGMIAPIVGAQLAVALYDIFLCQEEDSLVLKKL
ncbi:aquaporin-like protein [Favolaschia claudopus]|uniref:Aquaporin-like protein n=1 Tax=Favolaschia claudopus TaxID=2862362 RepID=A0AAV9ZC92_9AGAR